MVDGLVSAPCCSMTAGPGEVACCPASGSEGKRVGWTTVAALVAGPAPARQEFRLCRDPECEVVYFGTGGAVLRTGELTVQPGFKSGSDGLVCYCFLHREADIAQELGAQGTTGILAAIEHEIQAGNCACEIRNPSGKCCLGEVQETIRRLRDEVGETP